MLSGYVTWGQARARFKLLNLRGEPSRQLERIAGAKFVFTNGSATVTTDTDMRSILEAGDVLTPWRSQASGPMYFVDSVHSSTQLTLTENFGEATQDTVNGYTRMSVLTTPWTVETSFRFVPERKDGGAIQVRLANGEYKSRGDGFRVYIRMAWENVQLNDFKKLIQIYNHGLERRIEVQPHSDVVDKYEVQPVSEFSPSYPGGKLVGANLTLEFRSVNLVKSMSKSSTSWGGPLVF